MTSVDFIAVHCSATPPSRDIGARELDDMHKKRGFLEIGYHYVIRRDGSVEKGRPDDCPGAHVQGYNHCSLGICLVGGVDDKIKAENNFTDEQFTALRVLLRSLAKRFPNAIIQGHRDFPNVHKDCPSFDVRDWLTGTT